MSISSIDFLGLKTQEIFTVKFSASLVESKNMVAEDWHRHENFHVSCILIGGNLESRLNKDNEGLPGKLLHYKPGKIHPIG